MSSIDLRPTGGNCKSPIIYISEFAVSPRWTEELHNAPITARILALLAGPI